MRPGWIVRGDESLTLGREGEKRLPTVSLTEVDQGALLRIEEHELRTSKVNRISGLDQQVRQSLR